jgi:hypothetical protein
MTRHKRYADTEKVIGQDASVRLPTGKRTACSRVDDDGACSRLRVPGPHFQVSRRQSGWHE